MWGVIQLSLFSIKDLNSRSSYIFMVEELEFEFTEYYELNRNLILFCGVFLCYNSQYKRG